MNATLEFVGAAGEVTGSCTLLSVGQRTLMVDCGQFQGAKDDRERNRTSFTSLIDRVHAVLLTHAHLDHSGLLPRLVAQGYRGKVHTSEGTARVIEILLYDAAHLEKEQAEYANASGYSSHKPAIPLFRKEDVDALLKQVVAHRRETWFELFPGVDARFLRAGHILGASMIEVRIDGSLVGEQQAKSIVFSGDVGHDRSLLMRPPVDLPPTDTLILESTYGDRAHTRGELFTDFSKIAVSTFAKNGVLVIPAFAVGRAQEVLYLIRLLEDRKLIPTVPCLLDSPMAIQATKILSMDAEDTVFGVIAQDAERDFYPHKFQEVSSADESMMACMQDGPMIVISAAGMLTGGRILHHLKARLPDERNTILFVGYQADRTKGRFLLDHAGNLQSLRIHHQEIQVEAAIAHIDALSAHGDYIDLLSWLRRATEHPKKILLNHGNKNAMNVFAERLRADLRSTKVIPIESPHQKIPAF